MIKYAITKKIQFIALATILVIGCTKVKSSQSDESVKQTNPLEVKEQYSLHNYGGWYCPDNLKGFPPVDLVDWQNVPVITDRLPNEEDVRSEASLILVDTNKHPEARPLAIKLPSLAEYYCEHTRRKELVIIIQAIHVGSDSIVGFRFLNGGNGSAHLNEVSLLSNFKYKNLPTGKFVSLKISINAPSIKVQDVLSLPAYLGDLKPYLSPEAQGKSFWRGSTNINYHYPKSGKVSSVYANILFGNFYAQNTYNNDLQFAEKFLLLEDETSTSTDLIVVCGPFGEDYDSQKAVLERWTAKVKELSEVSHTENLQNE